LDRCAEEEDEKDDLISAVQFLLILEDSIRTFMTFLRADKRSRYEMFREMLKRRSSSSGDQSLLITLQKGNKKVSYHARMHVTFVCQFEI
jgi:hypothetical protein